MLDESQLKAFAADLQATKKQADADRGPEDARHLLRMAWASWGLTMLGLTTSWVAPNPLSILALSLGNVSRWTIVGHHVSHGCLDGLEGAPKHWNSKAFARGWRRWTHWFDWMPPEAWHIEHDSLHHYQLGEDGDPDVAVRNLAWLRETGWPLPLRRLLLALTMLVWKPAYYAPTTIETQHAVKNKVERTEPVAWWSPTNPVGRDVWLRSWLPNLAFRFALPAAVAALISPWAAASVLVNLVLAELLANVHSFIVVVPNHTGPDLPRFATPVRSRGEFLLRQVLGSANFRTAGDANDFLHGWLNYQIEHHLWPDLSPRQLRAVQPKVRAVCEAHGVPYVQESVWTRLRHTFDVVVGASEVPFAVTTPGVEAG